MAIQTESGEGLVNAGALFTVREQLTGAGNGAWTYIPRGSRGIAVILDSTGDGRIEVTNSSYANIAADTVPAGELVAWPLGDIGATKQDAFIRSGNAFRQVNISGTTTMTAVSHT